MQESAGEKSFLLHRALTPHPARRTQLAACAPAKLIAFVLLPILHSHWFVAFYCCPGESGVPTPHTLQPAAPKMVGTKLSLSLPPNRLPIFEPSLTNLAQSPPIPASLAQLLRSFLSPPLLPAPNNNKPQDSGC